MSGYLDKVARDVPASDVQASRQMRQAEALVHWTDVRYAVTRVHHHTGQKALKHRKSFTLYRVKVCLFLGIYPVCT